MKKITINAIVTNDGQGYYAYCPSIKGLHVWGETLEEIEKNIKDAIFCHLHMIVKQGGKIPNDEKPRPVIQEAIVASYCLQQKNHDFVYAQ